MIELPQDVRARLLENEEFNHLASQHHELEDRLHELLNKPHPSEPDLLEEASLKKRKLALKDRMEAIAREVRTMH
ncbi:MAG: YdcH family protein [Acidobacteria bacterium]|nr:YdcH family protein [Acidobacteriota bacterium]